MVFKIIIIILIIIIIIKINLKMEMMINNNKNHINDAKIKNSDDINISKKGFRINLKME